MDYEVHQFFLAVICGSALTLAAVLIFVWWPRRWSRRSAVFYPPTITDNKKLMERWHKHTGKVYRECPAGGYCTICTADHCLLDNPEKSNVDPS